MGKYGSDGIPLAGKDVEYATELWLEGPSAFWLHPEGPLSETTPEEYRENQRQIKEARAKQAVIAPYQNALAAYPYAGLSAAQVTQRQYADYHAKMQGRIQNNLVSEVIGFRLF